MTCPNCGSIVREHWKKHRTEAIAPNVDFLDITTDCQNCGYTWNIVGTKQLNKSDSEV